MPSKINIASGTKFNRWTVLKECPKVSRRTKFLCKCECGTIRSVASHSLISGGSKSCGCLSSEITRKRNFIHGLSNSKLFFVWSSMKQRCQSQTDLGYVNYGGRGIKVCAEWIEFKPFYDWAIKNGYREGLTLDRINNNGHYEPSNCRWTTRKVQNYNKRDNRILTYNGKRLFLSEWAKELNITVSGLINRLKKHPIEIALSNSKNTNHTLLTYKNETLNLSQWAKRLGVYPHTISRRLKRGWPVEKALTKPSQKKI
ncbi:MAG: hypothetical protein AB3N18_11155 [Allomuricauda sp.]